MAKAKTLDVWIVESNRVYTAVPFTVVTDWVTQGRLLAEDKVRVSGTEEWYAIARVKNLAAYLPRAEVPQAEDQAEALEPVAFEIGYKKPKPDEDDEVDMIPLIDVSLVLLIYFMMLLAATAPAMTVQVPGTEYGMVAKDEQGLVVLVAYNDREEKRYGLRQGKAALVTNAESLDPVIAAAREAVKKDGVTKLNLTINGDERIPTGTIREVLTRLTEDAELKGKIDRIYTGTGEKRK